MSEEKQPEPAVKSPSTPVKSTPSPAKKAPPPSDSLVTPPGAGTSTPAASGTPSSRRKQHTPQKVPVGPGTHIYVHHFIIVS